MMGRDGGIDNVCPQHPQPGDGPFFVSTYQRSHVGGQTGGKSAFDVLLGHTIHSQRLTEGL